MKSNVSFFALTLLWWCVVISLWMKHVLNVCLLKQCCMSHHLSFQTNPRHFHTINQLHALVIHASRALRCCVGLRYLQQLKVSLLDLHLGEMGMECKWEERIVGF